MRWSRPSVPQPLPGSTRVGPYTYLVAMPPAAVVDAYRAADAPVPAGAIVEDGPDGALLVRAGLRTSAIYAAEKPGGARYTISPSPPLVIEGGPNVPTGRFWARTRPLPSMMVADVPSLLCQIEWRGKPWVVMVATEQKDDAAGPTRLVLMQGAWADLQGKEDDDEDDASAAGPEGVPVEGPDAIARGSFGSGDDAVRLRWLITDELDPSFMGNLAPAGTVKLAKVKGLAKRRVIVELEGFKGGTEVAFAFDGVELRRATTDEQGELRVQLTIPPDTPPGEHKVTVTAGDRVVELEYRVLPPR